MGKDKNRLLLWRGVGKMPSISIGRISKILLLILFCLIQYAAVANEIDPFVFKGMQNKKQLCSDEVFIRRSYLTLTGRLPKPLVVAQFIKTTNQKKRSFLIDELLNSDEYVQYMVLRWGDILRIKSEFPSNLWPNGVQAYNRWLYESIRDNKPYDQFVSGLLVSNGSNFRASAVNFYRAFLNRTPENIYQNVCLLFLGSRTCDKNGSICFSQIKYKSTKEWKEEIVFVDLEKTAPYSKIMMPDKRGINLTQGEDWRINYTNWLTDKSNTRFSAVMANRMWYWLFGNGIVNEPDDWSSKNPPSNPQLIDFLTDWFIKSGYDMKALAKLILNSTAFQSVAAPDGYYMPQRLPAEVIVDALADVTGSFESYRSRVPEPYTYYPEGTRSVNLGDATVSSTALELFGRASRDNSLESHRTNEISERQLLYLMNSADLEKRIQKSKVLNSLCTRDGNIEKLCQSITLMMLSRFPTEGEIQMFKAFSEKDGLSLRDLASDILWTHINSTEFLFNH
jgi:hypothetical protein